MKTREKLNIGIIGAGIAGLSSALALLKQGHKISLIEKNQKLEELGAGIQLSPNATYVLNEWQLLHKLKAFAFEPQGVQFQHWKTARVIANFPLNQKNADTPYLHIHRAHLYQVLLEAVKNYTDLEIISGENLVDLKTDDAGCLAITENKNFIPKEYHFDFVLGCDGIHSMCKRFIEPNANARFTGNIAWRGLIDTENLTFDIEPKAHLVMAPGAHLVFYFVNAGKQLNYVAIKETDNYKEESWTQKGTLTELLENFSDWSPHFVDILSHSKEEQLYKWALYDRDPLNSWSMNRLVILGDAAHPVLPFLAQDATMAIEDAFVFAKCLGESTRDVGSRFYQLRNQRCARVLQASRDNMKLYHDKNIVTRNIRDLGCTVFDSVYPEFLNNKLKWLYDYQI